MGLQRFYNKLRRELYKPVSRFCLKSARTNYMGMDLKVPVIHGVGSGLLVSTDQWMSDCLSVFLKNKQGAVVDVGVNIGMYLVKLKSIDSKREYMGFEPNAFCNYYVQELIRENKFSNARILPFALSDNKGIHSFFMARKADKKGSLNDYDQFDHGEKYSCDVFTMPGDDFFDLLSPSQLCAFKIDVEGAELEVLRGLKKTIKRYRPYVFCEIWHLPEEDASDYLDKKQRLEKMCDLISELEYCFLATDKNKPTEIDIISKLEGFNNQQKRDYILVHKDEVENLRNKLAEKV
ncbi:MAG: FkbM family methyltransferase [Gammaproteobacteria bacterium]|nr:FkbM family methyltransferase [Gammaproteobacteria bacterium]